MTTVRLAAAAAALTLVAAVPARAGEAAPARARGIGRILDAFVCPVLIQKRGDYGPIAIAMDGDVWILKGLFALKVWDCPPYDN